MHAYLTQPTVKFLPIPIQKFGAWILNRRRELGYNIRKVGAVSGISRYDWVLLEQGYLPTTENENFLRCLAATLEIRFDDLVCTIAPFEAHFSATQDQQSDERHLAHRPTA